MRTHGCGEPRAELDGQTVVLCGWVASRRDHGGVVFLDLRDASGLVQIVIDPQEPGGSDAHRVRAEFVLRVEGTVRPRPDGTVNPDLATGGIEVVAARVDVLNEADPLPFQLDGRMPVDETLRLRHRYLDLRRPEMLANLKLRATVNGALRRAMREHDFTEVDTPLLVASTPEGARDFVVPSRLQPGSFYALPQSPQLLKQLLMVGGVDRYYQIAHCLRDEDLRADRQFEFVQLDLEMSFASADDVMDVVTYAVAGAIEAATGQAAPQFRRLTWHEAISRYGTDKPDLRFGMELVDLSEVFAATGFRAFQTETVVGLCVPGGADTTRSRLDALVDRAKQLGAAGLVWMRVEEGGSVASPVTRFLSEAEQIGLCDALGAGVGDLALVVAGPWKASCEVLGAIRLDLGRPPMGEGGLIPLWVVDFPLFEAIGADGRPVPAHHPFTMPHPDDVGLLDGPGGAALLGVRSLSYDLVCNGWELGSGSVRIHRSDLQARVLSLLGIDDVTARERFGFLLDAFRFGAPPHAGFAVGLDRLVAILAGEENIREVIAFPKTQSGHDPLTGAPGPIDDRQLADLGLRRLPAS